MGATVLVGIWVALGVVPAVLVGIGVDVLCGVGVLATVAVATGVFVPCPDGGFVAPGMNTVVAVPVVVGATVPAELFAARTRLVAVTEGTGVRVGGAFGVFVGVKNCSANASRVMTRSTGVEVAVKRGVRTISGRVSNRSPANTNGK